MRSSSEDGKVQIEMIETDPVDVHFQLLRDGLSSGSGFVPTRRWAFECLAKQSGDVPRHSVAALFKSAIFDSHQWLQTMHGLPFEETCQVHILGA